MMIRCEHEPQTDLFDTTCYLGRLQIDLYPHGLKYICTTGLRRYAAIAVFGDQQRLA